MKKYLSLAISGVLVLTLGSSLAFAQEDGEAAAITFQPVETFSCNYNDGKGPADLASAVAFWNDYLDGQDVGSYMAMTITPHFFGSANGSFDIGWLGTWPTGEAMGAGYDAWFSTGAEAAAKIYDVLNCDSHSNFASMNIKPPKNNTPPDNLVLVFSDCEVVAEGSWDPVFDALRAWAAYQTESGYANASWVLFPAYGGGGEGPDFKMVHSYANHTDLGKAYDLYGNGEGYKKYGELTNGLLDCDTSRVYNANTVRRMQQEE